MLTLVRTRPLAELWSASKADFQTYYLDVLARVALCDVH